MRMRKARAQMWHSARCGTARTLIGSVIPVTGAERRCQGAQAQEVDATSAVASLGLELTHACA